MEENTKITPSEARGREATGGRRQGLQASASPRAFGAAPPSAPNALSATARSLPAALEVALLAPVGKASPPPILWLQGSLLCAPSLWSQVFTQDQREPSRLPGFMSLPHSRWTVPGTKHLFCQRVWAAFNKSSLC